MGAKNKVISGDYLNKSIIQVSGKQASIVVGLMKQIQLNRSTVAEYEVVNEESRKSAASAVGRGLAGSLLLGPVGVLAGLSAKSKGVHIIALRFLDGKKSLIEVDDKIYKTLLTVLF